jgi:uncharacterized protein (TIGR02246 family)
MIRLTRLPIAAVIVTSGLGLWPAEASCRSELSAQPSGNAQDKAAIQKNAEAFVAAFHKCDAKALAAFWTMDGDYTPLTGHPLKGREAIEKTFREFFSQHKNLKVRIESLTLQFVTPDVAIEDGTSEVFSADGGPPSRVRYTNVHVKKDGQWLLSAVRDSPSTPPSNYEHLRGLEWVIGDWVGQTEKEALERISLAWAAHQNFIVGSFSTTFKGAPLGSVKQWIGWDPLTQRIRLWTFDESGAFGEGAWSRDGDKWTVKTSSVLQDGKKATATFIIAPVDADSINFQIKDRSVDGNRLPDTELVKMKRAK